MHAREISELGPWGGGWRLLMINDDDTFVCLLLLGCLGCKRSEAEATVRKRHRLLYEHTNTDTHTERKKTYTTHMPYILRTRSRADCSPAVGGAYSIIPYVTIGMIRLVALFPLSCTYISFSSSMLISRSLLVTHNERFDNGAGGNE